MPVVIQDSHPPRIPRNMLSTIKTGLKSMAAMALGKIRKLAEFTPMIWRASICSVTRMVPISDATLEPTFPARMRLMTVGENSSMIDCRVVKPTV